MSTVTGYKINIQKSFAFLDANYWKQKTKAISFTLAFKKHEMLQ